MNWKQSVFYSFVLLRKNKLCQLVVVLWSWIKYLVSLETAHMYSYEIFSRLLKSMFAILICEEHYSLFNSSAFILHDFQ